MFPITSRYSGLEIAKITVDGREVVYVQRRFLPPMGGATLAEHLVTQGERLDNITARYLGDPEQFWRVCDANNALRPGDLTREANINRRLRIPLASG
jgi:hypothetical protein